MSWPCAVRAEACILNDAATVVKTSGHGQVELDKFPGQ